MSTTSPWRGELFSHPAVRRYIEWESLQVGKPLPRQLTQMERRALAVAACDPAVHLVLKTTGDRGALDVAFSNLKKRYRRKSGAPLIYVGAFADSGGHAGVHLHLLLWAYVEIRWLEPVCLQLGMLRPEIIYVTPHGCNPLNVASYVFGQEEKVFGTEKHLENQPRMRNARSWVASTGKVLASRRPQLLAALDHAKNPMISDDELYRAVHGFNI